MSAAPVLVRRPSPVRSPARARRRDRAGLEEVLETVRTLLLEVGRRLDETARPNERLAEVDRSIGRLHQVLFVSRVTAGQARAGALYALDALEERVNGMQRQLDELVADLARAELAKSQAGGAP